MTDALTILKHAIAMIFYNLAETARVIAPGALMIAAAMALFFFGLREENLFDVSVDESTFLTMSGTQALALLIAAILALIGFTVMVVTWHRYVLLQGSERDTGLRPSSGVIRSYIWKSILLALLMIPVLMVLSFVPLALIAVGGVAAAGLGQFVVTFLLGWILMRLSLVLPAASIGVPMGFGDSWRATAPAAVTILWLVFGLSALNLAAQIVGALTIAVPVVSYVVQLALSLLTTLIGVSCLTTLYGMLIEGRQLDA